MLRFDLLLSVLVLIGDRVYFPQLICRRIQYLSLAHFLIRLNPLIYIFLYNFYIFFVKKVPNWACPLWNSRSVEGTRYVTTGETTK